MSIPCDLCYSVRRTVSGRFYASQVHRVKSLLFFFNESYKDFKMLAVENIDLLHKKWKRLARNETAEFVLLCFKVFEPTRLLCIRIHCSCVIITRVYSWPAGHEVYRQYNKTWIIPLFLVYCKNKTHLYRANNVLKEYRINERFALLSEKEYTRSIYFGFYTQFRHDACKKNNYLSPTSIFSPQHF